MPVFDLIPIACPKCGERAEHSLARLEAEGYVCPACGAVGDAENLVAGFKRAEQIVTDFRKPRR